MITGYADTADFCPYCGADIYKYHSENRCECEACGAQFYVIEADESGRGLDEAKDKADPV